MADVIAPAKTRCSVFIAISLDGFIARPDGAIDWLSIASRPGEDYGYAELFASIDTLVLGRKTHDVARTFEPWPYAGKRCVVLTHGEGAATPFAHGEERASGPPAELVARLAREGARHVYVDGGSVIQQFLAAGLVDDVTLSVLPILLGDGIRLFGKTGSDVRMTLTASRAYESGLVQLRYDVAR